MWFAMTSNSHMQSGDILLYKTTMQGTQPHSIPNRLQRTQTKINNNHIATQQGTVVSLTVMDNTLNTDSARTLKTEEEVV